MKPKDLDFDQGRLFEKRLSELLNPERPLYKMSGVIPSGTLEKTKAPTFPRK